MATIVNRGGRWRAQVYAGGVRRSRTFSYKRAAQEWAADEEARIRGELEAVESGAAPPGATFGDLLDRYARDVLPTKAGAEREQKALNKIIRDYPDLANTLVARLRPADFAAWRDARLKEVSGSTVVREITILSHACTVARREWGWLQTNPLSDVRRPEQNAARTRRPTQHEIEALMLVTGYQPDAEPRTTTQRVGAAFLFAIETAMRGGEICCIEWRDVHDRHISLRAECTKTRKPRAVPLSREARRIIEQLRAVTDDGDANNKVFALKSGTKDTLFRRATEQAMIDDLHFHDSRREALTRLSRVYQNPMDLARISGHDDLRTLQRVYYAPTVDDLADKLDALED